LTAKKEDEPAYNHEKNGPNFARFQIFKLPESYDNFGKSSQEYKRILFFVFFVLAYLDN
jgi:hypothetical protein